MYHSTGHPQIPPLCPTLQRTVTLLQELLWQSISQETTCSVRSLSHTRELHNKAVIISVFDQLFWCSHLLRGKHTQYFGYLRGWKEPVAPVVLSQSPAFQSPLTSWLLQYVGHESLTPNMVAAFTSNTGLQQESSAQVTPTVQFASAVAVCSYVKSRISKGLRMCTPAWVLPLPSTPPAGYPTWGTWRSRGVIAGISRYLGGTSGNGCRTPGDTQMLRGGGISCWGGVALRREGGRPSTQTFPDAERHAACSEAVNLPKVASCQ